MLPPYVSLITVVYNAKDFLESTIKSIIKQKQYNFEYIIIDGGSTDGTKEVIKKYETYINTWVSAPDKGIYDAMNKGINLAKGKYVIFINAQDELNVQLADLHQYFERDYALLYGQAHYIDSFGNRSLIGEEVSDPAVIFDKMPTCHQAFFYNRKKINLYNLNFKIIADRIFTYEVFLNNDLGNTKFIKTPICTYYSGGYSDKHDLLFMKEKYNFRKQFNNVDSRVKIIHVLNYYIRYRIKLFTQINNTNLFKRLVTFLKKKN